MLTELVKGSRNIIPTPLTPDRGHMRTGEVVTRSQFGKVVDLLVYREPKPEHMRGSPRKVLDPETGRQVEREGVVKGQRGGFTGVTRFVEDHPIYDDETGEPNPEAWREYILEPDGKGGVSKNFNFREDPAKEAERKAEAEREAQARALMDLLGKADPAKVRELLLPDGTSVSTASEEKDEGSGAPELPEGFELNREGRWFYVLHNGEQIHDKGLPTMQAVNTAIEQWRLKNA